MFCFTEEVFLESEVVCVVAIPRYPTGVTGFDRLTREDVRDNCGEMLAAAGVFGSWHPS